MSRLKSYYIESEIDLHLYTNGNEFMTEDRKEYRGTYHRYILTGEVYTLGEFTNKSKKLIKFQEELPEVVNYKLSKPDIRTKYITPKSYSLKSSTISSVVIPFEYDFIQCDD